MLLISSISKKAVQNVHYLNTSNVINKLQKKFKMLGLKRNLNTSNVINKHILTKKLTGVKNNLNTSNVINKPSYW